MSNMGSFLRIFSARNFEEAVDVTTLVCSVLTNALKMRVFGKSPVGAYLRLNQWLWNHLPPSVAALRLIQIYGSFLNALARRGMHRRQFFGTLFLRNRPQLELMRRLCVGKSAGSLLRIAVLACSNGAEVYSVLWIIRSAQPNLKVMVHAVDISEEVLELAEKGVYSLYTTQLVEEQIFQRLTEEEMRAIFDKDGDQVRIKSWIKEGITWHLGDARDPDLVGVLGPQDVVVANNFLCHMEPHEAERCLRNIARLVVPGGYVVVSGVDLDIRTKVAHALEWKSIGDLIEEIHDGDPSVRAGWPAKWWGLEPFNKRRPGWEIRYASVFQLNGKV
jgi:chemotaxis methyl-accepting protein methylase